MFPYRDDNPSHHFPIVTVILIAINVLVYLAYGFQPDYRVIIQQYGFIPGDYRPITFFTSMFLHSGLFHLIFNVWYLWLFGDNLEDKFGKVIFTCFYLFGGMFAILIHSYMATPETKMIPCIGASGAISAVMGGYVTLFPKAKVRIFFYYFVTFAKFKLSALVFLGIWFAQQLLFGTVTVEGEASGVAYWAHIGGFGFGAIFAFILKELFLHKEDLVIPQEEGL